MKKNNITVIEGYARLKSPTEIEVKSSKGYPEVVMPDIIVATGAHYRTFSGLSTTMIA